MSDSEVYPDELDPLEQAIRHCQWKEAVSLVQQGARVNYGALARAAAAGNVELTELLLSKVPPEELRPEVLTYGARGGSTIIMGWLLERIPCSSEYQYLDLFKVAIRYRHPHLVLWLLEQRPLEFRQLRDVFEWTTQADMLEAAQWVWERLPESKHWGLSYKAVTKYQQMAGCAS